MSVSEFVETDTDGMSRREVARGVTTGVATVVAPSFVRVASAATSSGYVELSTTATVPTDTSIDVTVYEDLGGTGTIDNQQTESIPDGSGVVEYAALDGSEGSGDMYYMEIAMSTSDDTVTPELDSMTITVPEETSTSTSQDQPEDPQGLSELWENFLVFVVFAIGGMGALAGIASKSAAIGAFAAYMVFAHIAVETGDPLLRNILYVTLVLIIIGMAFKMWRLEFGGEA